MVNDGARDGDELRARPSAIYFPTGARGDNCKVAI
jgi:hypothetical protein